MEESTLHQRVSSGLWGCGPVTTLGLCQSSGLAFLSRSYHRFFSSLLWHRTIPATHKAIALILKTRSGYDGEQRYAETASLPKNRLIWVPQEPACNSPCAVGVRSAAQAGPRARRSGGPSRCGCRDSRVELAHTKTKAVGRSTLQLPFSVLKRGETQGNNTWFLALRKAARRGKCCRDHAAQSVAISFLPLWICGF